MDDPFFNYEAARAMFDEIPNFLRMAYTLRYGHHWSIKDIAKELSTTKKDIRARIDYTRKFFIRTKKRNEIILKHVEYLCQNVKDRIRGLRREVRQEQRFMNEGASFQECFNTIPKTTGHHHFMIEEESPSQFFQPLPGESEYFLPPTECRDDDENSSPGPNVFFL